MMILTSARKPTWVSLIYHTELTTKKCKNRKKLKVENRHAQKLRNALATPASSSIANAFVWELRYVAVHWWFITWSCNILIDFTVVWQQLLLSAMPRDTYCSQEQKCLCKLKPYTNCNIIKQSMDWLHYELFLRNLISNSLNGCFLTRTCYKSIFVYCCQWYILTMAILFGKEMQLITTHGGSI